MFKDWPEHTCDGCGKPLGFVHEFDLNGNYFACSQDCARKIDASIEQQREREREAYRQYKERKKP